MKKLSLLFIGKTILSATLLVSAVAAQAQSLNIETPVTQYSQLKTLLTENAVKSEGMYEYDLDFKFIGKSFFGTKKLGKASVIGRNRISSNGTPSYFELTNDKLDQALKQILITPDDAQGVYIDILFSLNEWKKRGMDRGSEGIQLRIAKDQTTGAPVVYAREATELIDVKGTIVFNDSQIRITYRLGKTKQDLMIERNATLDMTLSELISGHWSPQWVKLATYKGGRN